MIIERAQVNFYKKNHYPLPWKNRKTYYVYRLEIMVQYA
jgi:adenine-specific DNA glycosylase